MKKNNYTEKEDKKEEALASKRELEENDNNINVSLIALEKLGEIGFNTKSFSTFLLANIIEDLYYERKIFDGSKYFDLSIEDNYHYKLLVDRFKVGNENLFRVLIAREISITDIKCKNINEIAYKIVNDIIKKLDSKNKILELKKSN